MIVEVEQARFIYPNPLSYRPIRVGEVDTIEMRLETLGVGAALPSLPLGLDRGLTISVDFDECYKEARERSRL